MISNFNFFSKKVWLNKSPLEFETIEEMTSFLERCKANNSLTSFYSTKGKIRGLDFCAVSNDTATYQFGLTNPPKGWVRCSSPADVWEKALSCKEGLNFSCPDISDSYI